MSPPVNKIVGGIPPGACGESHGRGSMSDTEAWRDEENAPRVGRPIGRVNVDDSVAAVPHTPHRTRNRARSQGPTLAITNTPLRIVYKYRCKSIHVTSATRRATKSDAQFRRLKSEVQGGQTLTFKVHGGRTLPPSRPKSKGVKNP